MRKSQIISLVILLALVTAVIWVGALNGKNNPEQTPTESPQATQQVNDGTVNDPEPTPGITGDEISQLPTDTINWSPSFSNGASSPNLDSSILEQMSKYGCVYDGTSFGQEGAYITFDVGYGEASDIKDISAILDALKNTGAKAIFFVTNEFFQGNVEDITKRIVEEGHQIGNRGKIVANNNMSVLTIDEYNAALTEVESGYKAIMGQDAVLKYFRPIGGRFSIRDLAIAKQRGYTTVLWTTLYGGENLDGLNSRISKELYNKAIFSIASYSVNADSNALKSALETASLKYALKQLP